MSENTKVLIKQHIKGELKNNLIDIEKDIVKENRLLTETKDETSKNDITALFKKNLENEQAASLEAASENKTAQCGHKNIINVTINSLGRRHYS